MKPIGRCACGRDAYHAVRGEFRVPCGTSFIQEITWASLCCECVRTYFRRPKHADCGEPPPPSAGPYR